MPPSPDTPPVTVITTTYNWPDALREAIFTVLGQTFTEFEYLIIGDCCTDNTADVIEEFDDPRIRWHNLATNTGNQSGANKVAMEMANGEYIAYLNHDDLWFPHHLEALLRPLQKRNLDVISSVALSIKPPGYNHRKLIGMPSLSSNNEVEVTPMTTNVVHSRRAAAEAGGWVDWRETHAIPTQDFFYRLRKVRSNYAVLNEITSLKFHSGDRKNSYRNKDASEQVRYRKIMTNDPDFRYRETMKAIAYERMGIRPPQVPIPKRPAQAPKGWQIEQWRLTRGLTPMLNDGENYPVNDLPAEKDLWVNIQPDDSTLVVNPPEVNNAGN